ncbi:MAG: GntR family transcriptional regulator [bacterium]|nr:GntR family transcriptional regulator [bacterium]
MKENGENIPKNNMEMPKYAQLKQIVKEKIRDGLWKSGDKIPFDKELCDELEVSKITVQKAKQELIAEGVLETLPGRRGAFVSAQIKHMSSSDFIGVALDDVKTIPFDDMLKGIEDKLWEHRLHPILCNVHSNYEKVENYFQSMLNGAVAGVIFAPVRGSQYLNSRHIVNLLQERRIPCVLLDRYIPGLLINSVHSDNLQASKELTRTLIAKGHRRILVVVGTECTTIQNRLKGHQETLQEAGISQDSSLIVRMDDILFEAQDVRTELAHIREQIQQAGEFTACYSLNDPAFRAAIQVILQDDLHVSNGRTIEFATYDYIPQELKGLVKHAFVVKQPAYKMGWEAARLLIDAITIPDAPIVQMTLPSKIVEEAIA